MVGMLSRCYAGNPLPPDDFVIPTATVKKSVFLDAFGGKCQFMGGLCMEDFIPPPSTESELSDSTDDENSILVEVSSNESSPKQEESPKGKEIPVSPNDTSKVKQETVSKDAKESRSRKKNRWSGVEYSDSDLDEQEEKKPSLISQQPNVTAAFGDFICRTCNIVMKSEITLQTHMLGKRHLKAVNAENVAEVAMKSLSLQRNEQPGAAFRYPSAPPRLHHKKVNKIAKLQEAIDAYKLGPLAGLSKVIEIRRKNETSYYCRLCEAPCQPVSIMGHLVGYKHQLNCLKYIDPETYEKYRSASKKEVEKIIQRILKAHERKHGRGQIQVEEELTSKERSQSLHDEPGPSRRDSDSRSGASSYQGSEFDTHGVSCAEDLDTSQVDFFCKVCKSHMNNKSMWEAHVIGKRHLKNKKKCVGESTSKQKSIHCPNEIAQLMYDLEDVEEPIVGLEFIKETQGEQGNLYNCFLCGACTSSYDIIDHLLTTKHQTKFLEAVNKKGKPNNIEGINSLYDLSISSRENLILEECVRILNTYGMGKVEVYRSKNMYTHSYGGRY